MAPAIIIEPQPADEAVDCTQNSAPNGGPAPVTQYAPRVVENFRRMRVVVIGAGFSGIYCGVRIPQRLRNIDLTIYEKNDGIGGTWYENRYPGCACDIPAHSYQYTFAPNPNWSKFYAPAAEIRGYLESVVERYSVGRFIKLSHRVLDAKWDAETSQWIVNVKNLQTGQVVTEKADVVISARGTLNEPFWPNIPGIHNMKIPVMHSATWDDSVDFKNKNVGIIGGGSSAIQIIPQLQKVSGTQLDCFVRGRTWISRPFGDGIMKKLGITSTDFSPEQREKFAKDTQHYLELRTALERDGNSIHSLTLKGTELQQLARDDFTALMQEKLAKKPHILKSLLPSFSVGCRRLTPGPGYLEALVEDNVNFINTPIVKANETGLILSDGTERKLDILVCATGFQTSAPPPFPVIGKDGQTMAHKFDPYPESYLSLATDGFPNYFMMLGPNGAIGTGPLTTMIERTGDYIVKCIRKLQKENIASMEPKTARVKDFSQIIEAYFKDTVYLDSCSSWYRNDQGTGPRISGVWPGSAMHAMETLRSPRWEDYDYTLKGQGGGARVNQLAWLGDGWSAAQVDADAGDLAYYLQPGIIDIPAEPLPENTEADKMLAFSH